MLNRKYKINPDLKRPGYPSSCEDQLKATWEPLQTSGNIPAAE